MSITNVDHTKLDHKVRSQMSITNVDRKGKIINLDHKGR